MSGRPARSLWWNIGAMFGNIAAGVKGDPNNPPRRLYEPEPPPPRLPPGPPVPPAPNTPPAPPGLPPLVAQHVREAHVQTASGPVTLRRTITDEVLPGAPPVPPPPPGWPPPPPPPPPLPRSQPPAPPPPRR